MVYLFWFFMDPNTKHTKSAVSPIIMFGRLMAVRLKELNCQLLLIEFSGIRDCILPTVLHCCHI